MPGFTDQQIKDTLKIIDTSIVSCQKVQPKLKEGSSSLSLNKNRLCALHISRDLLTNARTEHSIDELEKAITQITSIKNKSMTGISHAKEGSATYTRFSRIVEAMDLILEFLQQAVVK